VLDGQLILRNSSGFLAEVYGMRQARRLAVLVAVFFHLVMLGVVALVASVGLSPDSDIKAIVTRIGVILLLTALGHAASMVILSRLRAEQETTRLAEAGLAAQPERLSPRWRLRRAEIRGGGSEPDAPDGAAAPPPASHQPADTGATADQPRARQRR
jgi:hypothetical protein